MDDESPNGQQKRLHSPYEVVQRWQLPHGLAVAVALPRPTDEVTDEALARLHPEERRWARDQSPRRRVTWVGGRLALRAALHEFGVEAGPLFATDRGAPLLPDGLTGSVTHKAGALAVALVARQSEWQLGVDLELLAPPRPGIARKVLTTAEQQLLANAEPAEFWCGVILRFSIKEAVYKALDPFVRRYVDFDEVELTLHADGQATVAMALSKGEGPFVVEAQTFLQPGGTLLSTARVRQP